MTDADLAEIALPDGETLYIELETRAGGDVAWGREHRLSWEDLQGQVAKVSKWVVESVRAGLPDSPSKVGVEFGLKLTAETGPLVAALAKAGAEATIVVRLEWGRDTGP
ncbi:CU044_2847 family protein [Dactylosporangium sucinum]|uniref:Trypsin-co-occurring domain-containing protein n=1 Tax=Dactylosporangium sucinum TaxID=1424081 RepID=A0A917WT74_9ACTN|nr:CU044_2847 family protein [Dactylosporangium sucinum]GGM26688.1 hypothetical protein GCM10007977_029790 [Dactylosporangium sucinum]